MDRRSARPAEAAGARGSLALLLLAAVMVFTACGGGVDDELQGTSTGRLGWELRAVAREARLGLAREIHADGTYSYKLRPDLRTPDRRTVNGVSWRYDGQARFPVKVEPPRAEWIYEAPETNPPAPSHARDLVGSVSVDAFGRRWIATAVDAARLAEKIAEYDALVERTFGREPVSSAPEPTRRQTLTGGRWVLFEPLKWYIDDCDGDGDNDTYIWDSDSRSKVDEPMTIRQKKVVLIDGPGWTCSGTMVDDEWLLTAAHCVTTSSGTQYSASNFDVCTRGNYQTGAKCYSVDEITVAASYSGSGPTHDYAVMRLSAKPNVGWMAISQASNSVIKKHVAVNIGYTSYKPGCWVGTPSAINSSFVARYGYWSYGDVFDLTSTKIKTRVDLAAGHSGGPFYYYPNGWGNSHYITGVVSGNFKYGLGKRANGGPKGPKIRSWVIANTP